MRNRDKDFLRQRHMSYKEITEFRKILSVLDILYMTRIQKERFIDLEEYEKVKGFYIFRENDLNDTKDNFRLLHPLPRVNEISPDVDNSNKSIYFKQTSFGIPMRKAILAELMQQ
jgi:aspartate carbamoyltransferase catalytic subunit